MHKEILVRQIKAMPGVLVTGGHFVYKEWGHGDVYFNKTALMTRPNISSAIGQLLADECEEAVGDSGRIKVVMGPAVAGAILAQWLGYHLSMHTPASDPLDCVFADKEGDDFIISRGFDKLIYGRDIIVCEDVLNSGGSARKVVRAARAAGANVLGVAAIVNRGGLTAESLDVPFLVTILDLEAKNWPEDECPICKERGIDSVNLELGHGKKFLERKKAQTLIAMQTG